MHFAYIHDSVVGFDSRPSELINWFEAHPIQVVAKQFALGAKKRLRSAQVAPSTQAPH